MPHVNVVALPVGDLSLLDHAGRAVSLAELSGTSVLVLLRHRH